MKLNTFATVLMFIILLPSCDKNNSNEINDLTIDTNNQSISTDKSQSNKTLKEAIDSLKNIDKEFRWKDTHLIIQASQNALNNGEFKLSTELAMKVIAQTKLMDEQKDFAENNWQNLIPIKDSQ